MSSSISTENKKRIIEVVAAIILHNDKILCVQRGENKFQYISRKYEFPGGKIEEGESMEQAVIREIQEELHLEINPEEKFMTVNHDYPDFCITMHSYICSCSISKVTLTEHIDYKWLSTFELERLIGLARTYQL